MLIAKYVGGHHLVCSKGYSSSKRQFEFSWPLIERLLILHRRGRDLEVVDSVNDALCPLEKLTDVLSAEKNINTTDLCPLLTHLSQEVLRKKDTVIFLTKKLKRGVHVHLECRYVT